MLRVCPGADEDAVALGVVDDGAGVEVGRDAGEVGGAAGAGVACAGVVGTTGGLLTARTACGVGPAAVCWLPGWAAGCCVGSRAGRVNPGIGTPLSRLISTRIVAATSAAVAVRMPIRSARVLLPVASANTVRLVVCRPNRVLSPRAYVQQTDGRTCSVTVLIADGRPRLAAQGEHRNATTGR